MKKVRKPVKLAPRRWRRQFSQPVRGSIFKTLTEPITNAVDSYKRLGRLSESSGIVDRLLKLAVGSRVEHDEIVRGIHPKTKKCIVTVLLARTKKTKLEKRTVRVTDQAEGMSFDDLDAAVSKYGEEKSKQSEGAAVRGLFGQGISDVLWGHDSGLILSIRDDQLSSATFAWDDSGEPDFELTEKGKPTKALRKGLAHV